MTFLRLPLLRTSPHQVDTQRPIPSISASHKLRLKLHPSEPAPQPAGGPGFSHGWTDRLLGPGWPDCCPTMPLVHTQLKSAGLYEHLSYAFVCNTYQKYTWYMATGCGQLMPRQVSMQGRVSANEGGVDAQRYRCTC